MNIRNIFKRKLNTTEEGSPEACPSKELFVEQNYHAEEKNREKDSAVEHFLKMNHFDAGLHAGYHLHCHDGLKEYLERLRSSFREAVDAAINNSQKELLKLEIARVQFGDMLETQRQCLDMTIDHHKNIIEESRMQKVLSVDNEGWISSAVSQFKLGFQKGMMDYFTEKEFFINL
jgi:hypothetical protein